MQRKTFCSALFGVLGGLLAAAALVICLTQREAEPRLVYTPQGAVDCVSGLMTALSSGNLQQAAGYLYGTPQLASGEGEAEEAVQQLWAAFTGSLEYDKTGSLYATSTGLAQDVTVRSLDMSAVLTDMGELAPQLLEEKVAQAATMDAVYDENQAYRQSFIAGVMEEAAAQALADAPSAAYPVTLNLIYDAHRWWVMPDQALLCALSGGILE